MHRFEAELWQEEGEPPWHFLTVPADVSDLVLEQSGPRRGFGSVRVQVTVGGTTWRTSVFPDSSRGAYVLPVKKAVRSDEQLEVGDRFEVVLEVL